MAALTFLNSSWSCQSFFDAPFVVVQSLRNGCSFKTCFFRPFDKSKGFVQKSYFSVSRCVSVLFSWRFPSDVSRLIISVVVDSSKRMIFAWSKSNIGQKIGKIFPSFANSYSSSAIMWVSLHRRIFASSNHRVPSSPFFGSFGGCAMTVFNFHKVFFDVKCQDILHQKR